jgi:hypothetical protein
VSVLLVVVDVAVLLAPATVEPGEDDPEASGLSANAAEAVKSAIAEAATSSRFLDMEFSLRCVIAPA